MERGQKVKFVDCEVVEDSLSHRQMSTVNRVKRATIKCDSFCLWIHDRNVINYSERCALPASEAATSIRLDFKQLGPHLFQLRHPLLEVAPLRLLNP